MIAIVVVVAAENTAPALNTADERQLGVPVVLIQWTVQVIITSDLSKRVVKDFICNVLNY